MLMLLVLLLLVKVVVTEGRNVPQLEALIFQQYSTILAATTYTNSSNKTSFNNCAHSPCYTSTTATTATATLTSCGSSASVSGRLTASSRSCKCRSDVWCNVTAVDGTCRCVCIKDSSRLLCTREVIVMPSSLQHVNYNNLISPLAFTDTEYKQIN